MVLLDHNSEMSAVTIMRSAADPRWMVVRRSRLAVSIARSAAHLSDEKSAMGAMYG